MKELGRFRRFLTTVFFLAAAATVSIAAARPPAPEGFPGVPVRDLLVRQWRLADGLPVESLTGVLQTRDGFLWITSYEGLFRFDGLGFEVFDKPRIRAQSAPESTVPVADAFFALAEDRAGDLWIAGQGGQVLRHRRGRFHVVEISGGGSVEALCVDNKDRLWIGGSPAAFVDLAANELKPVLIDGLAGVKVQSIACRGETVWLGTDQGDLLRQNSDGSFESSTVMAGHALEALAPSRGDALWIGSRNGLARHDAGHFTVLAEFRGVGIYDVVEDRHGDLWLATSRGLARRRPDGRAEWLAATESGPREAHALGFDREGNLWVAGRRGGLVRLVKSKLTRLTSRDGLRPGSVDAILERHNGDILVGFDDYLAVISPGSPQGDRTVRIVERTMPASLGDVDVLTMLEDHEGHLWIGSYLGLLRLDDSGGFERYTAESGFPSSEIRALYQDTAGVLWIGTGNRGVVKMSPNGSVSPQGDKVEVLDQDAGLVSNFVFSIDADRDGRLLLGMRGGFHRFGRDGTLETFRAPRDFPGSLVFSIFADHGGDLWLSTDGGLTRFDGEGFRTFDQGLGLPTDVIFEFRQDGLGFFWITSSKGLIRGAQDELDRLLDDKPATVVLDLFDEADGMSHRQCAGARRILEASDGRLWIPTLDGVTIVDPRHVERNEHVPPVVVDRFQVDGKDVERTPPIAFEPGLSRYSFALAVLSLRDPTENRVRYRLQGFDQDWQEADGKRVVSYTSLPHGHYVFHAIGRNGDGLWNERGVSIAFEVKPYIHETYIFRGAAFLLFVALVTGIYQWRSRTLRRRHRELRRFTDQKRRLAEALQRRTEETDRYLYIFSHDFKNSLLTIRNFAGAVRRDAERGARERLHKDIDRITSAAEQMNDQLDDLLKVAAVDRAMISTKPFRIAPILREAVDRAAPEIARRGVELMVDQEATDAEAWEITGDRGRLVEAVHELIRNAVKFVHDEEQPKIEIGARREDGEARIWVRDNGIGIASIYHDKVFRPLEQLDPRQEGTGIGLALVSRVVEHHGGRVWVESQGEGSGTTVWLTLPLREASSGAVRR